MFVEVAAEAAATQTTGTFFPTPEVADAPDTVAKVAMGQTTTNFGTTPSPCATAIVFLPETKLPERNAARIFADVIDLAEILLFLTAADAMFSVNTFADANAGT